MEGVLYRVIGRELENKVIRGGERREKEGREEKR